MCYKAVIDYSYMSDIEMMAYIKKHGLGCGKFRDDQLGREILPHKRKNIHFFYLPLIAALLGKPLLSTAQSIPDTTQAPVSSCKQQSYDMLENKTAQQQPHETIVKRFGTGNVCTVRKYHQIPLTPFYIMQPNKWFKDHLPIFRLGYWHIPFITKR